MTNEVIARMISAGTVAIEDGTKAKEEFAPARKAKVELSFTVPEGLDGTEFLNGVADIAEAKLNELLGRKTKAPLVAVTETAPKEEKPAKAPKAPKAEAPKPVEKTKEDLAREAGLPATDIISTIDEAEAPAKGEDDLGDVLGEAAPAPITDAELGKAAQEKNARMKAEQGEKWAPSKIRDLISEFAGVGKRINDIPAAKRPDFMAKLKELK